MKRWVLTIFLITLLLFPAHAGVAQQTDDQFVKTANYYLLSGDALKDPSTIDRLAKFDLLVLPVEAQVYNDAFFKTVRRKNPDIKILAYVATVSFNFDYWHDPLHQDLLQRIEHDWWLRDETGQAQSVWPGTQALNLNTGWTDELARFADEDVMGTGYWDGIFYDEVMDSIDWNGPVDIDNDGTNDPADEVNRKWQEGLATLFSTTRNRLGSDAIIISNGSSLPLYTRAKDGRMFETFPSRTAPLNHWARMTRDYLQYEESVGPNPTVVVNVNTKNTGARDDYQRMRFGLATTLLGEGYFSYDFGTQSHAQLWYYDEYEAYLGAPKEEPQNLRAASSRITPSVWERDFEEGKVLVNATNETQTVELDGSYEKLHGEQVPSINDGSIVNRVTLPAKDGLLLLRPIENIRDGVFLNGAFARVFNKDGGVERNGFFAYEETQRGGSRVVRFDVDNDGRRETVTADRTWVRIYEETGALKASFAPYTAGFNQGINLAVGDIENDGTVEIITGTEDGGGPQIRIFNGNGNLIHPGFFAYGPEFRGGVNVALGDLDGDAVKEIIAGAGVGGGPHIRVFNKDGRVINPGFFAFDPGFRGGVNVASGDVDGDTIDDIVAGPGFGGAPQVRVYNKDGGLKSDFFAFERDRRDGVDITATDLNNDGVAEIIGLSNNVFTFAGMNYGF
jgi:hypothetical protein